MVIETLISKMLETKDKYPALSNTEILRLYNIESMNNLTLQVRWLANKD